MRPESSERARALIVRLARLVAASTLFALVLGLVLVAPRRAHADDAAFLPRELDALGAWITAQKSATCSEHCFVLQKLTLGGAAGGTEAGLTFQLEGSVLADKPVAVPLFGPPGQVRLEEVTEDGKPAFVGFDVDHYFVFTGQKHFVLKGKLALEKDLALTIPGPLNALDAALARGRVVEGAHLSGLAATTIHFELGNAAGGPPPKAAEEPTVFQLARAVRVTRETQFEYRLTMKSGSDLGVIKLPLVYGEKVIDVIGSTGHRLEGTDLLLPTAGHEASITIRGTLPDLAQGKTFAPDPRSKYEWWQLENDPEHRLTIGGTGKQLDAATAPFTRDPSTRLYLVEKEHTLAVSAQTLATLEALAAIVREHARTVVVTPKGDLVIEDTLSYENNGIDYLAFTPTGRAIYTAADGYAERIMQAPQTSGAPGVNDSALLVPLRKGSHYAFVQSLSQTTVGAFGGRLVIDAPAYALTASRVDVRLGLPASMHPIVALGGEKAQWFIGVSDVAFLAVAFLVAALVLRGTSRRMLGAIALAGVYVVSPPAFVVACAAAVTSVFGRALLRGFVGKLSGARHAVIGGGVLIVLVATGTMLGRGSRGPTVTSAIDQESHHYFKQNQNGMTTKTSADDGEHAGASGEMGAGKSNEKNDAKDESKGVSNGFAGNLASVDHPVDDLSLKLGSGVLDGVTPVALPLPTYERSVSFSRQLVTKDRPMRVTLVYVTDLVLVPLGALWAVASLLLFYLHRRELRALLARGRAWLATPPAAPATTPAE